MKNGRCGVVVALAVGVALWPVAAQAAEHGGDTMEHGGQPMAADAQPAATQEHGGETHEAGGQAMAEPSAEQIRQAIRGHIEETTADEGAFTVEDEQTGQTRTLELVQVHERVGKTGGAYYSCTDMKDTATGEMLDLDFDVASHEGELEVTDTRIHKVNGQERYTYDANSNRIPPTSGDSTDSE